MSSSFEQQALFLLEIVGLDAVVKLKKGFEQIIASNELSEFQLLVTSPVIHFDERFSVLEAVLHSVIDATNRLFIENYLRLLLLRPKFRFEVVLKSLTFAIDKANNVERVVVRYYKCDEEVRVKIEKFSKSLLKSKLNFERLEIEWKEDESLIGGFVIVHEVFYFDYSISGRISKIRKELSLNVL